MNELPNPGMMRSVRLFSRLALIHARELLHQPFCLLLTLASVGLTLALPLAFAHTFGDTARRLARDGGLAFQLVAGIALAAYAACALTGRARQSGTEAMILCKPVPPSLFFLSRYAGIAAALFIFSASAGLATLLADRIAEAFTPQTGFRIDLTTAALAFLCLPLACVAAAALNAWRKAQFHLAAFCILPLLLAIAVSLTGFYDRAGHRTDVFTFTPSPAIIPASLLITAALLVFCALAMTTALLFRAVTVTSVCFAVLAAGLASEWMFSARFAGANPVLRHAFLLLPNWQRFWLPDIPTDGSAGIAFMPVLVYALLYSAAVLAAGCVFFQNSEHSE